MIIVGLTDLHGDLSARKGIEQVTSSADLVLLAGDITHFGGAADAEAVLAELLECNPNVLAVPGNCDQPEVVALLEDRGLGLHGRGIVRDGIGFLGVGGSLPCPSLTPNETTEDGLADALNAGLAELPEGTPLVMVVHHPPYDTALDDSNLRGHVGSRTVRSFIEANRPLLCLSGHIHEAAGTDAIGECKLINPGPLRDGQYAHIEIAPGPTVQTCEIRTI